MKNMKEPKPELFRLSREIWDSLTYEEIVETANAMREIGIFKPPYVLFDVECPADVFFTFNGGFDPVVKYMMEERGIYGISCHYDCRKGISSQKFDMTFLSTKGDAHYLPWMVPDEASSAFQDIYSFVIYALIVVLASNNVVKNQTVNDARARSHKVRTDAKKYNSTTTISIGKITEYVGQKSEGSGRTVRAHLRRGHVKGVRCGQGRKEIRKVFINPVFVNADRDWIAEPRKSYNVVSNGKTIRI